MWVFKFWKSIKPIKSYTCFSLIIINKFKKYKYCNIAFFDKTNKIFRSNHNITVSFKIHQSNNNFKIKKKNFLPTYPVWKSWVGLEETNNFLWMAWRADFVYNLRYICEKMNFSIQNLHIIQRIFIAPPMYTAPP